MTNWVVSVLLIAATFSAINGLRCHSCAGWKGKYAPGAVTESQCNDLNNFCDATQFCVKMVDPIKSGLSYVTYTSGCWNDPNIVVSNGSIVAVANGQCYQYRAASLKLYEYCFCMNMDYCNGVNALSAIGSLIFLLLFANRIL